MLRMLVDLCGARKSKHVQEDMHVVTTRLKSLTATVEKVLSCNATYSRYILTCFMLRFSNFIHMLSAAIFLYFCNHCTVLFS